MLECDVMASICGRNHRSSYRFGNSRSSAELLVCLAASGIVLKKLLTSAWHCLRRVTPEEARFAMVSFSTSNMFCKHCMRQAWSQALVHLWMHTGGILQR